MIKYAVIIGKQKKLRTHILEDTVCDTASKTYKYMRDHYPTSFYYRVNWEITAICWDEAKNKIDYKISMKYKEEFNRRFSEHKKIVRGRKIELDDGTTGIVLFRFDSGTLKVKLDTNEIKYIDISQPVKRLEFVM